MLTDDDRQALVDAVVAAAREWRRAHEWAAQNPEKMVKSMMTADEAAEIMREYFAKRDTLLDTIAALDRSTAASTDTTQGPALDEADSQGREA